MLAQQSEFVQCAYCHTVVSDQRKALHVCPPGDERKRRPGEPAIFDPAADPCIAPDQVPATVARGDA